MQSNDEYKRLFFGFEVKAPWPTDLPEGRFLAPEDRHLTIAFLGKASLPALLKSLKDFPKPRFLVGKAGFFDKDLFLPPGKPRVIAWHVSWWEQNNAVNGFQKNFVKWLQGLGYKLDDRPFLPHVTLARSPFKKDDWQKAFVKLPICIKALHLYESVGNLVYKPCWSYPLTSPFEEFEHTADMAFEVTGENYNQLYFNAFTSLAFKYPSLVKYFCYHDTINDLDTIIDLLNSIISRADQHEGCPIKAVSYHGNVEKIEQNILRWEMIADV